MKEKRLSKRDFQKEKERTSPAWLHRLPITTQSPPPKKKTKATAWVSQTVTDCDRCGAPPVIDDARGSPSLTRDCGGDQPTAAKYVINRLPNSKPKTHLGADTGTNTSATALRE